MTGVDLDTYRFDYDLTFAVLLMNADGTIYHLFGGRERESPTSRLSMPALIRLLRETIPEHEAYARAPSPPPARPRRVVEEIPAMRRRLEREKVDCIHCHTVYDMEREEAQSNGTWDRRSIWRWPLPDQAGMTLDVDDPQLVKSIAEGSAAARAGARAGDRLVTFGSRATRSMADAQWALEDTPWKGGELPFQVERGGVRVDGRLPLSDGWREGTPLTFSWRPSMWGLEPTPGFGGPVPSAEERAKLGLARDAFAVRVEYIVDWGDHPEQGQEAAKAGLRKGDVVVAADGEGGFADEKHFQAWFRLTRKAGTTVALDVIREGERLRIALPVLPEGR